MAKKLGTIKSISGSAEVIAVDKSGNQRVLKVGDSLYEGETVKTTSADSKVVIATNNGKELSMIGEDTLSLDPKATAADSQVAALQKALLNGANLEDLEETAAGGNSGGRGDGMSLGETRFEHGGHYSNISASTSAINPLGAASFAGPAEGKSGGLDSGRGGSDDDTAGTGTTIDPETTRKPSNPEIKFPEDTNKDGKISDDENKAGDKDAGKTTVEVTIPKDGSVKPGDKVVVTDDNGKKTEKPINQDDIDKGKIDIPVDLNPGKDNNVTAEIINPNNPNNPGKDSKVIGEDSENTKAPEAPVITEVIDDVKGYGEDTKVGNVLDVKGHLTNDKTPTIKGTAKAGSKVEIYDNGDRIGETTAKADGSWEFTPELTKQGEHKFTATAENKFGKSTPSNEATIDLDSIAPKLDNVKITPIDTNSKADDTAELTMGTGHTDTPNAEILFRDENNNIIGKGHANSAGDFLIQLDKAVQPGTPVVVQAIDKAGNAGTEMAIAGNIEHPNDTKGPKVDIDTVTPVDDTNPSDGTPDKGIVKGKSDEPNAPVVVTDENGKTIGTGTTDDKGNFEITTDPIKPGDKVKVEVTDKAGHKGSDTETAGDTEILHKDLPEAPVITEVIDDVKGYGEDTKVGNVLDVKGHLTNDKTPTIKGTAKAGSKVEIYDNGDRIGETTAKADGSWEFTPELTKQGEHKFTATAENKFGKSTPSNEATIDLDSIAPKLDNVKITPIDTNSKADDTAELTMGTGHTDTPNAEILFRDENNNIIGKGHANSAGDFLIQLDKAVQPGTPVVVQAIDKAGNAGTEMATAGNIEHPNDHTAPSEPTITFVEDVNPKDGKLNKAENSKDGDSTSTKAQISVPGDAEENDVIHYTVNGEEKTHTITYNDRVTGYVEIKVPVVDGKASSVTAKIVDQAGNASKEVSGSIDVDLTIGNPKVRFVEDTNNDGVLSVAEVAAIKDGKAHWVIDIPTDGSVKAGDVIQSIDGKGNWVKFVEITDEMIKDGRFEATFNVGINKLKDGKYETPEYRFADDAGNVSDSSKATLTLDSEFSRKPSNPEIKFPEDTNKDGKISDDENKAGDKDAGKTTVEVTIPKDGSVKPGDKVVVTDDNGKKTEKPINQDDIDKGKIDIPVDLNPGKDNNVTAEIINPNNPNNPGKDSKVIGEASSTVKVTIDEIIDDVTGGVVNGDVKNGLTNDNLPTFKGSAAPGATVEIYESFYTTTEKTLVGKVTADANGKWSFTPTEAMSDGEHYFEAVATDKVGNKSTSDRVSLDVDTFADAPVIDAVNDNVDSQTGNVLDAKTKVALTNDSTPTLEGYAEPDSVITIYEISELNGEKTAIGTVTADNHGGWKFELPELGDGEYKYTTRAQDKAGNISGFSEVVVVNADLIAPSEPTITFVEDVNPKDGKLNKAENSKDGDSTSTKAQISVPGDAEENDVIHYTVNGEEKTHTITYNDRVTGYVEIKVPVVDGKASSVTAKIVDQAGNASKEVSNNLDVDIHIDAPVITAVTDNWWGGVENGGNILGVNDGFTNDTTPTFKGTAEAGSTIVLKNGNDIINKDIIVKADANGNWEFTPKSPLAEGEYNVVAIATDKAGNVSNPSNVATVNVDTSTTQPIITEIIDDVAGGVVGNVKNALTNDNLPTLKGTAEAFSTVKIIVDDKLVFKDGKEVTVTADKDGNWEYTFEANLNWGGEVHAALEDGVHTLKVQTTDRAGNRSAVSEWSSVDVDTTIGAPTVKITTDINSDKKIDIADASALKDGKLKWVIDIPENTVKAGDRVQILGSDAKTWTDIFKVTAQDIAKGFIERDEFSIDMPKSRGFQTPSYRLVDDAGNVSEGSMDAVKIVGFAPKAPTIIAVLDNEYGIDPKNPTDINAGDTTGNVLEGTIAITNDKTPTLIGKAEAGTTITLKNGDTVIAEKIPVDANGNWHYEPEENSPWADGDYEIKAIAKNVFGKESESSSPITVTVDTTGPEVTLTSIEDSVKTNDVVDFTGNVKDKFTNDNTPLLKGTAEAGSVIIIKYGEHHENVVTTKADKNGHWDYKITNPLSDGEHIISYQAVDKAGNTSLEYVANVTVDTKIADAKVEFIEDTNNDGKFSWKENIENPNIGRMAWKAIIPQDGSIKEGDIFHYRWGSQDSWHSREIKQSDIERGFIGEKVQNQYEQGQPNAGKPLAFGANANGRVYEAEAYFSDAAGNQGKVGSDKVVFDFSDKPADPVKNIKINAEAIYGDNDTGLWLEGHGPVLKASTELQPQLNGNDNYEIDVKTITHKAEFTLGSGDDVVNIHKSGNGWGWINMDSKIDLGDGNNRLIVAADLDSSTVISGKGDDYIEIKDDVANGAKIITGAGNDTVIVGDTVANTIFTKVGISTGDGNDSVTIKGDAIDKAKIDLGNGDDTLTIKAAHVIGGVDDKGALDGGKGYDKLIISSPEDTIDLKHVSYHAKNFEELDISGDKNTTLKVGIEDVLDMTDDKHTLKITGDKGDTVDLKEDVKGSGWHQGASEDGYTTYTNNTVTIQIKDEIHVI